MAAVKISCPPAKLILVALTPYWAEGPGGYPHPHSW